MLLNRKSAKQTSRVSLFIAVIMLSTVFTVLHVQGYQVDQIADSGIKMCKDVGIFDLFVSLLW